MTNDLETYIRNLILASLRPDLPNGDLHIDVVAAITFKMAAYIRSLADAERGHVWRV